MAIATSSFAGCPLCGERASKPSWLGSTHYQGRQFDYVECTGCHSLYCDPMPDESVLAAMYGCDYQRSFAHDEAITDPKEPQRVVECLRGLKQGIFLDYGCGKGELLAEARDLGWQAIGIELDREVARQVEARIGVRVIADRNGDTLGPAVADVLHLGDVLEHLTDLERQMPLILRLVRPGGLLIAQGPLENNDNLFASLLRWGRQLRSRRTEMAPYHVMLATAQGQHALFRRFGLETVEYSLREVSWPAPAQLSAGVLRSRRLLALFVIRRCSQALSTFRVGHWGNRYFYVGRVASPQQGASSESDPRLAILAR